MASKSNSLLNLSTDRMMEGTTLNEMKYDEWHHHVGVLKKLINRDLEDIDYVTLAHALLSVKVVFSSPLEEENFKKEWESLEMIALGLENIACFLQDNPMIKDLDSYISKVTR